MEVMVLAAWNDDENSARGKGMRITVQREDFGSLTRSNAPGIVHQETFNLGDGIFMDICLQEDFGSVEDEALKTRTDDGKYQDLSGEYTILGYYDDGRFAGANVGTVTNGIYTPKDDFKFHDGNYTFVCVSNVDIVGANNAALVTRGQAKTRVAQISTQSIFCYQCLAQS